MIHKRAVLVAAALLAALTAAQAMGADCTMGRYTPSQTSFTSEKLRLPLALNWEFVGNKSDNNPAAPVVADGTVFFSCGDRIYAVDLETGSQKWRYPSDVGLGGSIRSTPAVVNGNVYFGAGDNLYCVNAATGSFKWAYQTRGGLRCPPVISDGAIYVGSDDNSLYSIDAETGEASPGWTKPFVARDDIAVGVAVNAGMAVVSCMDGNMYGVMANSGKLRWQFRLPAAPTDTSPVTADNITVMAVSNVMYGLTARSGQIKWMTTLPSEAAATPAVLGYDVYIPCRDKKIYCYSTTGRRPAVKWSAPADLGATPMSSPVIAGDILWVTGSKGVVAAFSIADGSLKWRYSIAPSGITAPGASFCDASASATVAEGALLVATDDGVLHCFTPDAPDSAPPGIFSMTPVSATVMSGAPPIKFSAVLYDVGSGVDFSTATMLLDGQPVDGLVTDVSAGTITYQTPTGGTGKQETALRDGVHTITVKATDYLGNALTKDWYIIADASLPPPRRAAPPPETGKKTKEPKNRNRPNYPFTPPGMPGSGTPPEMPPPPPPPPMPTAPPGGAF